MRWEDGVLPYKSDNLGGISVQEDVDQLFDLFRCVHIGYRSQFSLYFVSPFRSSVSLELQFATCGKNVYL